MNNKVIDFIAYKIEKSMKREGFVIKRDMEKILMFLSKLIKIVLKRITDSKYYGKS